MATVNNRTKIIQAVTINGVDAGGTLRANIAQGYDNTMRSSPDGMQGPPLRDRETEFTRGTIVTQDWPEMLNLLTGAVGTLVFYQVQSGVAAPNNYRKHTIINPVIHNASITFTKGGYAECSYAFECRAADETKGFLDQWTKLDGQTAPTYLSAARGGWRIVSGSHGGVNIFHTLGFEFAIAMRLRKASNDGDVGYTAVDVDVEGMTCGGSLSFQDGVLVTTNSLDQRLAAAARGDLVLVVKQGGGAASKTITIAKVEFDNVGQDDSSDKDYNEYTGSYEVANDTGVHLTLSGANKIITIV